MKYIWQTATAVLIVLLFASVQTCSSNKSVANNYTSLLTDTVNYYKNRLGTITATKSTLQLENKQLQNLLINKDIELRKLTAEFSKIRSLVKYETVTLIDSIPIVYKDTVPCVFKRSGTINEKWYTLNWQSDQKGIRIDSLHFENTVTVINGLKRNWFLGEEILVTDITNSNPYLKTNNITSAEITIRQPWFKKWFVWFMLGSASGFLFTK
ncbi:hypothetical protein AMR72_10700 [Flavobacterium psychrophilum]|nr:hypothetical protein AMR72_10700 [Flavobacterium psychrophilum]AOE52938.1 hypothetical protein ALW18_10690 [Flavobacterium psychrophilum]